MKYKHACITIISSVQGERCETYTTLKISHCKEIYFNAKTSRILLMLYTISIFQKCCFCAAKCVKIWLGGEETRQANVHMWNQTVQNTYKLVWIHGEDTCVEQESKSRMLLKYNYIYTCMYKRYNLEWL